MGRLDQLLEQSNTALPLGDDFSGRIMAIALDDDPSQTGVLKCFAPLVDPEATARLRQRLWRLQRLNRPECAGLEVQVVPAGIRTLAPSTGLRLSERALLSTAEAFALLGHLAALVWACHQGRVRGLRFQAAALDWSPETGVRWLAPDLVPVWGTDEEEERADLQALAAFVEGLLAEAPREEAPLRAALTGLSRPGPTAAIALRAALATLNSEPVETLQTRSPGHVAEVGRAWQLEELAGLAQAMREHPHMESLWLVTEDGACPETFWQALPEHLGPLGVTAFMGACRRHAAPLEPLRPLVESLLARRPAEDAGLTGPLAPLTHWLPAPGPTPLPQLPPALAKLRLFQAIAHLLSEAAAEGTLAVLLLDYAEADEVTREFLAYLAHHAAALPIVWVLEGAAAPAGSTTLELGALSPEFAEAQLQTLGGSLTWTDTELQQAWHASLGVPARLIRVCAARLRHGAVSEPQSATGPVRNVLEAVAVAGGALPLTTLLDLEAEHPEAAFAAVDAALDAGWLHQRSDGLVLPVREEAAALVAILSPEGREAWHHRLAALPARLTTRLLTTAAAADASVLERSALAPADAALRLQAVRLLTSWGATNGAEALLSTGLTVVDAQAPEWLPLHMEWAALKIAQLDPVPAVKWLTGWLAQAEPSDGRTAWHLLGRGYRLAGEPAQARVAFERALQDEAAAPGEDMRRVSMPTAASRSAVMLDLANVVMDLGEFREGRAIAEDVLEAARKQGDMALQVEATLALGRSLLLEGGTALLQGEPHLYEVIAMGEEIGHGEAVSQAYQWIAHLQLNEGQLEPALGNLLHHQAKCRLLNQTENYLRASIDVGWTALQIGYFESALLEVEHLESSLDEATWPELLVQAMTIRAVALMVLGYLHDPLRLLDHAQRLARKLDDGQLELVALGHLVFALLFMGKYSRAVEVCEAALLRAAKLEAAAEDLRLQLMRAEIHWRQGELEAAEAIAQQVLRREDDEVTAIVRAEALLSLARINLTRGHLELAREQGQRAFGLIQDAGYLLLQAELCTLLGELERHEGSFDAASTYFEMALSSADLMNSPHHRAVALDGLARCTADPADATSLRARASENMNVYLEQLSEPNKRDFLHWAERQQVLHPAAAQSLPVNSHAPSKAPVRPRTPAGDAPIGMLDEVMGLVGSKLPLEELLQRLNEIFHRLTHASRAMIFLVNEDGELKLRDRQVSQDKLSVLGQDVACEAVLARVHHTGQTLWVPDTAMSSEFAELPEVRQMGLRGLLCVPLKVTEGDGERVVGCLYGDSTAAWTSLSEAEVGMLEMVARYTSVILEVGLLQEESARKAHRLDILNQLSRALAGTLDLDRLLNLALGQILEFTQGEQGYIFFGDALACRASLDRHGQPISEIQVSRSVIARVQRDRQPLAILDIGQDEELQSKASIMIRNIRSVMCVPLILDDQLVGMTYISSATANKTFTRHDLDLMTAVSAQVALALQNAQAFETIKELNQGLEEKVRERTSELTHAYQELSETQTQLLEAEKLATIGTLAGGVAHEINNPLGAILTNAQLLLMDVEDEEQRDSLALIEEGAKRCQQIVSALLRYSREAKNSHEPVEIRDLVDEALNLFEPQITEANIRILTDLTFVPSIMGDPVELRQVLAHLFFNAIDAIKDRHQGTGGCLQVRLARSLAGVELSIQDDGIGMAPEVIKRVYDPFFTTKKVGSGQGLGLAVCLKIIEKHHGKITAQSQPGQGATFTVVLPVP